MPRITVSMPARNVERYVSHAVASVLRQTFTDFELLIVDDCSSDGTEETVRGFDDPRIRLIRNPAHRGIGASHNRVLQGSDSELIIHVDADDLVTPDAFGRMVDAMADHPGAPAAHCYFDFIDDTGRALSNRFTRARVAAQLQRQLDRDYRRNLIVHGSECANHLRTYRRNVLDLVGGFNESLRHGEDLDMALRLVDRAPLRLVPHFLYHKRIHRGATTEGMQFQGFRCFLQRSCVAWKLWRTGRIRFPKESRYRLPRLIALGLRETCVQMIRSRLGRDAGESFRSRREPRP